MSLCPTTAVLPYPPVELLRPTSPLRHPSGGQTWGLQAPGHLLGGQLTPGEALVAPKTVRQPGGGQAQGRRPVRSSSACLHVVIG